MDKVKEQFDYMLDYYKSSVKEMEQSIVNHEKFAETLYAKYVKEKKSPKEKEDFIALMYEERIFSIRIVEMERVTFVLKVLYAMDPLMAISEEDKELFTTGILSQSGDLLFVKDGDDIVLKDKDLDEKMRAEIMYIVNNMSERELDERFNSFVVQMDQLRKKREEAEKLIREKGRQVSEPKEESYVKKEESGDSA